MPDQLSLSKFVAFCLIFFGIIAFCIVFGGYTSFYRAQNRIEASITYLTDACQYRLDLLPELIEMTNKSVPKSSTIQLNNAAENTKAILLLVTPQKIPLEDAVIRKFEISQTQLTLRLNEVFAQLETSLDKKYSQQFIELKNEFLSLQDHLTVTRNRYNDEASYFNNRTMDFPSSLFAKIFGFDKIKYIEISKERLLPSQSAVAPKTS